MAVVARRRQPAVDREIGAGAVVGISGVAGYLGPTVVAVDSKAFRPIERRREVMPVRRKGEVEDDFRQAVYPAEHHAGYAVEDVDLLLRISRGPAGPATRCDDLTIRADRHGAGIADIARAGRQADGALPPAVVHRPDPHRLVLGAGHGVAPCGVDIGPPDPRGVHAGIEDQRRAVVEAGRFLRERRRGPGQRQNGDQSADKMSAKAGHFVASSWF